MVKKSIILFFVLSLSIDNKLYAEDKQTFTEIATVVAIGSIGAILGLSTLSFVEKPSDHLHNIIVGGAFGLIAAVALISWNQAHMSSDMYGHSVIPNNLPEKISPSSTLARRRWHGEEKFSPFHDRSVSWYHFIDTF